jgi:hypothetical protein
VSRGTPTPFRVPPVFFCEDTGLHQIDDDLVPVDEFPLQVLDAAVIEFLISTVLRGVFKGFLRLRQHPTDLVVNQTGLPTQFFRQLRFWLLATEMSSDSRRFLLSTQMTKCSCVTRGICLQ